MGLGIVTLLAGMIVDKHGYGYLELFFMGWLVVSLICMTGIYWIDIKGTNYLNMGINARIAHDEAEAAKKAQTVCERATFYHL